MDDAFLNILRCPITTERLKLADDDLLREATESQLAGRLKDRQGLEVEAFEFGLVNAGGQWFYPVRNDIPSLIPDQAVSISDLSQATNTDGAADNAEENQ